MAIGKNAQTCNIASQSRRNPKSRKYVLISSNVKAQCEQHFFVSKLFWVCTQAVAMATGGKEAEIHAGVCGGRSHYRWRMEGTRTSSLLINTRELRLWPISSPLRRIFHARVRTMSNCVCSLLCIVHVCALHMLLSTLQWLSLPDSETAKLGMWPILTCFGAAVFSC